ncbi:hypothetical protein [Flavobacterium sp. 102]|uniref:hypothetical protein n=1 Tax=Flavobacterium sp. 102 TaxID=2135623 RepID=UPI000EAC2795|nr:hypothetical protein [Flavobacterium sp. 102]RKS02798.1 hypothetical protein C8C84_2527 [Flavobacterium sp. 102]
MKIKKNFNYIIFVSIIFIAIYLWTIFVNIKYDPNYTSKSHHDYGINGFLVFFAYAFGWLIFVVAIFQIKYYLNGKDNLYLITFILASTSAYILFLLFVCGSIENLIQTGSFKKGMALFLPSIISLIIIHTKGFKKIHLESKVKNYEDLRRRLGIQNTTG